MSSGEYSDCTPNTAAFVFDGGYSVSLCYETAEGLVGEGRAGIWASGESGLMWFFSRENAEMLVKVLNGCAHNGYRWAFVAPVTDVAFNLHVTSSRGNRWIHRNRLGDTAATRSDITAFRCETNDAYGADLSVRSASVRNANLGPGDSFTLRVVIENRGDSEATPSTLSYYRSRDSTITMNDRAVGTDLVRGLAASETSTNSISLTAPSTAGAYYYGACVDSASDEGNTANNCSDAAAVTVSVPEEPPELESEGDMEVASGDTSTWFVGVANAADDLYSFGSWSDQEDIAVVEQVRGSKSERLLLVTGNEGRNGDHHGSWPSTAGANRRRSQPSMSWSHHPPRPHLLLRPGHVTTCSTSRFAPRCDPWKPAPTTTRSACGGPKPHGPMSGVCQSATRRTAHQPVPYPP